MADTNATTNGIGLMILLSCHKRAHNFALLCFVLLCFALLCFALARFGTARFGSPLFTPLNFNSNCDWVQNNNCIRHLMVAQNLPDYKWKGNSIWIHITIQKCWMHTQHTFGRQTHTHTLSIRSNALLPMNTKWRIQLKIKWWL